MTCYYLTEHKLCYLIFIFISLADMSFFYISAPELLGSREATIKEIRQGVINRGLAKGGEMNLQKVSFKMANLDTLMFCNDKALKLQNLLQGLLKKIDKQYLDLAEKTSHEWWVKSEKELPVKRYFSEFVWNDSKFLTDKPILHIVSLFQSRLATIENLLRTNTTQFNEAKQQLNQFAQKQGNYNVKDLSEVIVEPHVKAKDFHYTKFVTTVVCVVPTGMTEQFKSNYWKLTDYVIPQSEKKLKIPEKDGLALWTVDIFSQKMQEDQEQSDKEDEDKDPKIKQGAKKQQKKKKYATPIAEFIDVAREKMKIVVREFKFESGQSQERRKKREALTYKLEAHTTTLKEILKTQFSESYELYIHTKIVRMIIETRMRFGSDRTVFYWLEPAPNKDKSVQSCLIEIFGDKQTEGLYGTKDEIEDGQDFFPFIYVPGILF